MQAEVISHGDCAPLQIVCPACKEPVFKSVLARSTESSTHYFSHYKKDRAYVAECELRVRSISETARTTHDSESRGQRLSYFLKCFSRLLVQDPYITYQKSFEQTQRTISQTKPLKMIRKTLYENAFASGLLDDPEHIFLTADEYVQEMTSFGEVPKTDFSLMVQRRIARDIFEAIHTEPQRSNYAYLFGHALLVLYSKYLNAANHTHGGLDQFSRSFLSILERLISGDWNMVESAINELMHNTVYPPFVEEPLVAFNFLAIEITYEMVGTLLRLPYFDLLKEYESGRQGNSPS